VDAAAVVDVEAAGAEMRSHKQIQDRVGLGWRPELAAGIFANAERIDVLEVIAEDWFDAPVHKLSALRTLATQFDVQLHGVSAGMASSVEVEEIRLAKMAKLYDFVQPEAWSEHLAFVRADGIEIGHLAAPPRNVCTVEATAANIYRARRIVGIAPMIENIATLIDPPASPMSEPQWLTSIVESSGAPLLLDLHNLYSNAINFSHAAEHAPTQALEQLPLDCVETIHIAGGSWVKAGKHGSGKQRWLDDHLHPVPDPVFKMLEDLAAAAPQPLTVVLERDGKYPPMEDLLHELALARLAMQRGRVRRLQVMEAVA